MSRPSASTTGRYFDESAGFLKKRLKVYKRVLFDFKIISDEHYFSLSRGVAGPRKAYLVDRCILFFGRDHTKV